MKIYRGAGIHVHCSELATFRGKALHSLSCGFKESGIGQLYEKENMLRFSALKY
jgi:tRNA(Phe) wybutosine-synthesizing methylase Tyw3